MALKTKVGATDLSIDGTNAPSVFWCHVDVLLLSVSLHFCSHLHALSWHFEDHPLLSAFKSLRWNIKILHHDFYAVLMAFFFRASSTLAGESSVENLLGQSDVIHPDDMANPYKLSPAQLTLQTRASSPPL